MDPMVFNSRFMQFVFISNDIWEYFYNHMFLGIKLKITLSDLAGQVKLANCKNKFKLVIWRLAAKTR